MWKSLIIIVNIISCGCAARRDIHTDLNDIKTPSNNNIFNDIKVTAAEIVNNNVTLKFATYCMTPNQQPGFCVELSKCNVFAQEDINPKHEAYDFFVASNCTPQNAVEMKVCCGNQINFVAQIPKQQQLSAAEEELEVNPLPDDCGQQKLLTFSRRIFGGKETAIGEFPWMARIIHRNKYGTRNYGCSAFLIHSMFVATAAHCVSDSIIKSLGPIFQINLGDHNTTSQLDCTDRAMTKCAQPPQIIKAGEPVVYSGYNNLHGAHTFNNDIALIPLRSPAAFTDFVRPICLLDKRSPKNLFTISGWGKTESEEDSSTKKKVDIDRFSLENCWDKYQEIGIRINKKNQLCAGGKFGKDSCTGDSGGPLMVEDDFKWYAEGIVSFGYGCGRDGWPGVYTNIPKYLDWIKKTITRKLERKKKIQTKKPKGKQ